MSVTHCTIVGNGARNGGGISISGTGTLTLANTIVAGNTATSAGREIQAATAVTSGGHNLLGQSGETTSQALAGFPPVDVAVSGLMLANGRATGEHPRYGFPFVPATDGRGGAILKNSTGTLGLTACAVSGGAAVGGSASDGGAGAGTGSGIYASASVLNLSGSTFANNAGTGGNGFDTSAIAGRGGAVCTVGSAVVNAVNCTFSGNSAAGFSGADTFTYQPSGGYGGTATGTVNVDIIGDDGPAQNITKIALRPDGSAGITFAAIPGRTYRVQSTDSLAPANWQNRGMVTADATGRIDFTDPPPLPPARFYRSFAQ